MRLASLLYGSISPVYTGRTNFIKQLLFSFRSGCSVRSLAKLVLIPVINNFRIPVTCVHYIRLAIYINNRKFMLR